MKRIYLSILLLFPAYVITEQPVNSIGRIINASIIANVDGKFPIALLINFRDEILCTYPGTIDQVVFNVWVDDGGKSAMSHRSVLRRMSKSTNDRDA